ncbi:MAG: hypothetical protein M0C28_41155 [Candidatus Moduliflexus flocculans]|nr:hypothetical protein [Candidatus Moduliflexus flocculans]
MQAVKRCRPLPRRAPADLRPVLDPAYVLKFILENFSLVKIGTTQAQRKLFFRLKKEKERLIAARATTRTPSCWPSASTSPRRT